MTTRTTEWVPNGTSNQVPVTWTNPPPAIPTVSVWKAAFPWLSGCRETSTFVILEEMLLVNVAVTSTSSPSAGDDGVIARPSTLKLTSPALSAPMTGTKNKSNKIPEVMMAEARPMYTRDHILHFNPAD